MGKQFRDFVALLQSVIGVVVVFSFLVWSCGRTCITPLAERLLPDSLQGLTASVIIIVILVGIPAGCIWLLLDLRNDNDKAGSIGAAAMGLGFWFVVIYAIFKGADA